MSIEYTDYFEDVKPYTTTSEVDIFDPVEEVETVEETTVDEHPTMMGVIYNTQKVYMREAPTKEAKHIDILEKDEEVMIDGTEEDILGNAWYHLITASGKEGYTMSEFVKIVE